MESRSSPSRLTSASAYSAIATTCSRARSGGTSPSRNTRSSPGLRNGGASSGLVPPRRSPATPAPVPPGSQGFAPPGGAPPPAELDGWYLRNGPNPRQATAHWFTGDGMIHGVRIEGGRAAWYRNRWVRTDSFSDDFPLYNADGTRNLRSSVANTHVVNHAGKTLALIESSLPYQISNDLETLGALRLRRKACRLYD